MRGLPSPLVSFRQLSQAAMSFNTFGHLFRVTTFGESHGPAIGCVVDGCPPRIPLTEADIQPYLDRRRPGQSRYTTQRQEPDAVRIVSGVFVDEASGKQGTTGTSISVRRITLTSKTNTGRVMPITPMTSNMACVIIAAAAVNRRAKPRCGSPPARLRARSYRASNYEVRWCKWGRIGSIVRAGIGTK